MHRFPRLDRWTVLALLAAACLGFGLSMEPISKWGPWMDLVSIYIIPLGATLGAISWFWILPRQTLMEAVNLGAAKPHGSIWYHLGKYLYVPLAILLCAIALIFRVAF